MRPASIIIIGLLFAAPSANAAFWIGQTFTPPANPAYILPIGAGGYLTGISVANDGTMVTRTDTYGAYIWNASAASPVGTTGSWQQLITAESMPATFVANAVQLAGVGVWDVQLAPSNSSILYMVYNTYNSGQYPAYQGVYKSTNQGATWTLTNFTPLNFDTNFYSGNAAGGIVDIKATGPKIAIDPTNPNIVYVGTGASGLFYSTDGGNTWNTVSTGSVPAATEYGTSGQYPGYVLNISGYNDQDVFAFSYNNGLYESTDGGGTGTWTPINNGSGPMIVERADVDVNTGDYWCIDGSGNVWRWNGTVWNEPYSSGGIFGLALDPNTANHVVIANGAGQLSESTNGTSFGSLSSSCGNPTPACSSAGDITWMTAFDVEKPYMFFDRSVAKKLYGASDRNFWNTTYTGTIGSGTAISWNSQGRGIEQLVANNVIVPTTDAPLVANWDTAVFAPSFNSYPSAPVYPSNSALFGGWSIDWASSNTSFIAVDADSYGDGVGAQESAYSSNGASGPWTAFPTVPPTVQPNGSGSNGSIAVSSTTNMVWAPAGGYQPYYTTTCCSSITWNAITLPGISSWATFQQNGQSGGKWVAADRYNTNTFYMYYDNVGFFSSSNGGATWSSAATYTTGSASDFQIKAAACSSSVCGGDFWFSGGNNTPGNRQPCSLPIGHFYGGMLTIISNAECGFSVGFGANPSGGYPAVYCACFVNVSGTWTFGIWESDNAATGSTPTWTQMTQWPFNSLDSIGDISGDPGVAHRVYIGLRGAAYLRLNFLLNRDLDPASNDNSPVGLNKAA